MKIRGVNWGKIIKLGLVYKGERMRNMYCYKERGEKEASPSSKKCQENTLSSPKLKKIMHNRGKGKIIYIWCFRNGIVGFSLTPYQDLLIFDVKVLYKTFMIVNHVYCYVMP